MPTLELKPTHKPIRNYYKAIQDKRQLNMFHEGNVAPAFADLLGECTRQVGYTLSEQYTHKTDDNRRLRLDGAVLTSFNLLHGIWEAKDSNDRLEIEVEKKTRAGYPQTNILYQDPDRAILIQDNTKVLEADLREPPQLVEALKMFFAYEPPHYGQWEQSVAEFKTIVPTVAQAVLEHIHTDYERRRPFHEAFTQFYELCRVSINPNLQREAVEEMLVQHLLTERIFRKVFQNSDFARRNAIAAEIEKVIDVLVQPYSSRDEFTRDLNRFYGAIEVTAATIDDYAYKQDFLNTVYEQFFQGFDTDTADTHGIVYTPQPIVDFMVQSVEQILKTEFGRSLADEGVQILDPFVGTGNFILRVLRQIAATNKGALRHKYQHELHCNEVMLLPYYIASQNIEHTYLELAQEYVSFEGICLVDTFELAEPKMLPMFAPANTERIDRQRKADLFVILGNPPYNVGQQNENDNNKNRKYKTVDERIKQTYVRDSQATLRTQVYDAYVRAFRWASDRVGEEGIVAFVTNSGFIDGIAFDGMRMHLGRDFDALYVLDLGGNVRKNPKLSGTTHNVFGIQVGVSINLLVRKQGVDRRATIRYARVGEDWRRTAKYAHLNEKQHVGEIDWQILTPTTQHIWLSAGMQDDWGSLLPLGTKEAKRGKGQAIFEDYSIGVLTGRDKTLYNFAEASLSKEIEAFCESYNAELDKYRRKGKQQNVDNFVNYSSIKWSRNLKRHLTNLKEILFSEKHIRTSLYRPYTKQRFYFDEIIVDEMGLFDQIFPNKPSEQENKVICVSGIGSMKPFHCLITNLIPSRDILEKTQCFPFYRYAPDGTGRKENLSDWALAQFQQHYQDDKITKWDIFYAIYALLHHPQYRERYAANLKRELPRLPYVADFAAYAATGRKLADLHLHYETVTPYPLGFQWAQEQPVNYRVEKMSLSKDKTTLIYNKALTLTGIPAAALGYRLGNRSALEWLIDQYQVSTDSRSGIVSDPNQYSDDEQYIVKLVQRVIQVSLETVQLVDGLPD